MEKTGMPAPHRWVSCSFLGVSLVRGNYPENQLLAGDEGPWPLDCHPASAAKGCLFVLGGEAGGGSDADSRKQACTACCSQ